MKILGISAFFHDAAAAIVIDGEIIAACEEERFTRIKHDSSFPEQGIRWCLSFANLSLADLDAVVFYEKPLLKFNRILSTHIKHVPYGIRSFLKAMPVWLNEKLFLKRVMMEKLQRIQKLEGKKIKILFSKHHLSHAASAFFASSFEEACILTIDGVGEWATASIGKGKGNKIAIIKQLNFPDSLGLLYSAFTGYCGFRVNSGEFKLMGLAPYGNRFSEIYLKCIDAIGRLADIKEDGSLKLNPSYFRYSTGPTMVNEKKWENLFGFPRRKPEGPLVQKYCDMALAIQNVTEEVVIKMAKEARRITDCKYLCMAGGVALNAVANGRLLRLNMFRDIFVQPAAGDAGCALGAALAAYHIYFNRPFNLYPQRDKLQGALLGPETSYKEIVNTLAPFKAVYEYFDNTDLIVERTALLLKDGFIVGWYHGRSEFGPRALGARSILADPRDSDMRNKLNKKIKFRENFRPFAPAVLAEDAADYFEVPIYSPYMSFVDSIKKSRQMNHSGYTDLTIDDKLNLNKSDIPAVTHIDGSARVQTVHRDIHPLFWKLIHSFKKLTGCSMLINTSFNVRNEPIVNSPEDAYRCFMRTDMDYLVIENLLFVKDLQPEWKEDPNWQKLYCPD